MNIKKLIISSFKKFSILVSILLMVGILSPGVSLAYLPDIAPDMYYTNGSVSTIAVADDGTQYIGGSFTYIGPNTGMGGLVSTATGSANINFPQIGGTGSISAVISDGSGGWFIGGNFTKVGETSVYGIAHILSDGSLDADWGDNGLGGSGIVRAFAIQGSNLYVGGSFSHIGGQDKTSLAILDVETGLATDWNSGTLSIDDDVYSLAIDGTTLYVGGLFENMGGVARSNLASFDTTTGLITSWAPNPTNRVKALAVSGSTLYVGGSFTSIASQARNRIASFNTSDGSITAWNPNATSGEVSSISVLDTVVYASGTFTNIGGQARNRIAALNVSDGLATAWNPNANNTVRSVLASGFTVYAGGDFTTIGGQTRNKIAALNVSDGLATSWDPSATGTGAVVSAMYLDGTNIYVGGSFRAIGGKVRNYVASIDADWNISDWNPNANQWVNSLVVSGSTIYVGGDFTSIGGQSRNRIAALNTSNGLATSWDPNADDRVMILTISGGVVYAGGSFTSIGGQSRNRIAALNTSDGLATSWDPNADDSDVVAYVLGISVEDSTVYVGGQFDSIGGQTRENVAAIDKTTGFATGWNPNVNNYVKSVVVSDTAVYIGGNFQTVGGESRKNVASVDKTAGLVTLWNPNASTGTVESLISDGNEIYTSGQFSFIGGQSRRGLSLIDRETGLATAWNPNQNIYDVFNITTYSTALSGSYLFAGANPVVDSSRYYLRFPITKDLTYTPGDNGTISGDTSQTLSRGGDGTTVTAIPNEHYHFLSWSDGVTTAERTDTNVTSDISVTANFEANPPVPSSGSARGTHIVYKPPVKKEIAGCGTRTDGFSILTGESCKENEATTPKDTPTQENYDFGPVTLKLGMSGDAVKELQNFLNRFSNAGLIVDGKFGPKTLLVVREWQEKYGLVVDGLVGIKTKESMNNVAKIN